MKETKTDNISILHVVLGASNQELENARTAMADTTRSDLLFVLCDERMSSAVDDVLQNNAWDMVCITAAENGEVLEQALRLSKIAKERGALSLVVIKCKSWNAAEALAEHNIDQTYVLAHADSILLIPEAQEREKGFYSQADNFLSSIRKLLDDEGIINLDFFDVSFVLKDMGAAYTIIHTIKGSSTEERLCDLANNDFMPKSGFSAAKNCLLSLVGCNDIDLDDVEGVIDVVRPQVSPNAYIFIGTQFDDDLVDEMRVTVLISGFDM